MTLDKEMAKLEATHVVAWAEIEDRNLCKSTAKELLGVPMGAWWRNGPSWPLLEPLSKTVTNLPSLTATRICTWMVGSDPRRDELKLGICKSTPQVLIHVTYQVFQKWTNPKTYRLSPASRKIVWIWSPKISMLLSFFDPGARKIRIIGGGLCSPGNFLQNSVICRCNWLHNSTTLWKRYHIQNKANLKGSGILPRFYAKHQ